jgi:lysophospholipase L1-like esterase
MPDLSVSRRRSFGLATVVVSLALVVLAGLVGSGSRTAYGASNAPDPGDYYLALGDSITYGIQPTKAAGARPSAFNTGFVDVFAASLRKLSPTIDVVNYGCPGESTVTFASGGCPAFRDGIKLHDPFRGPQLKAALALLNAQPAVVTPITLTLFGNDWFPMLLDTCKAAPACVRKHAPKTTAAFASRLRSIIRQLHAAAPTADIIVTGAWNPDPNTLEQLGPVYRSLEAAIAQAAKTSDARVAKMLPVFNPAGSVQKQKARLCAFTFICSKGDPHPTNAGYRAMADAVLRASG